MNNIYLQCYQNKLLTVKRLLAYCNYTVILKFNNNEIHSSIYILYLLSIHTVCYK
jgi:hypothetical protein